MWLHLPMLGGPYSKPVRDADLPAMLLGVSGCLMLLPANLNAKLVFLWYKNMG